MADKLADFVVGIGVKGQNVALTEINKIKKAGKELSKTKPKLSFQNVRAEVNARKQIDLIKRQTQATRGQTELAKINEQRQAQVQQKLQGAGQAGANTFNSAMTTGVSGIAGSIPLAGSFFSAASSAVESAGQEYIQGVTSSKNIQLVTANYGKAFSAAYQNGLSKAIGNGAFTGLAAKAFYTSLTEQGVKADTAVKAAPNLDLLARSQGVGSIDELMGRLQGGTLKENAGLSKADITLLQSQSQLLNNRFTSDIGTQMLTQTLQRLTPQMQAVAGTKGMKNLSGAVGAEQRIQDRERYYSAGATSLFKGADTQMYKARGQDREMRADMQGMAQGISNVQYGVVKKGKKFFNNLMKGDFNAMAEEYKTQVGAPDTAPAQGGTIQTGDSQDDDAPSTGPTSMQMDSVNNDMLRSGQAIANTLAQINNQLNVMRAQMRGRG